MTEVIHNLTNSSPLLVVVLLILFSYVTGSIPSGFLIGKIVKKIDIRKYGSGNVGATNTLRVLGWKLGVTALIFDILKGLFIIIIARNIFPEQSLVVITAGFAVICGHILSIFLKFKGGKGVATSAGVFIALTPQASALALLTFLVIAIATKYVSAGSIAASVSLIVSQLVITINNRFENLEYLIVVIIVATFIILKHKDNIKRLLNGTEDRISFRKNKINPKHQP